MKLRILNMILFSMLIYACMNCSIGSAREACKNNLKMADILSPGPDSCEFGSIAVLFTQKESETTAEFENRRNAFFNFNLLNCYQYYEKLQKCNKEEKKYLPAIYSKE
ncbi:hypothetical protein [Leptospira sp. P2653]|uniref:hypothetical protein n=1 Tax=Leptospira sp. P2653 TaxID=1218600 RepID=UPI000567DB08|nr:hypothetical protein [Leptospira sp. P2653]